MDNNAAEIEFLQNGVDSVPQEGGGDFRVLDIAAEVGLKRKQMEAYRSKFARRYDREFIKPKMMTATSAKWSKASESNSASLKNKSNSPRPTAKSLPRNPTQAPISIGQN
jgi:hypothetical protein